MANKWKDTAVQPCGKCGSMVEHTADMHSSDLQLHPRPHACKPQAIKYSFGCVAQQAGELFHVSTKNPVTA